jgi:HK97 family phage prohead protease
MTHPSTLRARQTLARREQSESEFAIWQAQHDNEIIDAQIEEWKAAQAQKQREENDKPLYTPAALKVQQQRLQQQGLSARIIRREAPIVIKASGHSADGREFIITSGMVDRYQDIVVPEGLSFKDFMKNSVALFSHDATFPIGTWEELRYENGTVRARLVLAKKGSSARLDEIRALVDQKILRACSIGFLPIEHEPLPNGGIKYTKSELVECSLCTIPANKSALAVE